MYDKYDFIVDPRGNKSPPDLYNTFVQAPFDVATEELQNRTPLFHEYLTTVLVPRPIDLEFLINWISYALNDWKTGICVVLMGLMGTAKDFFGNILQQLIGNRDYYRVIGNMKRIDDKFNGPEETNIFTSIQEVDADAGGWHHIQNRLKTLITEPVLSVRKMATDPHNITSNYDKEL